MLRLPRLTFGEVRNDGEVKKGDCIRIKAEDYNVTGQDITGLPDGNYIHILFKDTGMGMTEEVRRKAFDPLFSTKEMGDQKAP